MESGGLLLGHVRETADDHAIVAIEDLEPFVCEHLRGPSYTLSTKDRVRLYRHLQAFRESRNTVVGFYRSHTRPGLFLDQYDFELMRTFFGPPSGIALVAKPEPEGAPAAGFFSWEDGDMQRAKPYHPFRLDAAALAVAPGSEAAKAAQAASQGSAAGAEVDRLPKPDTNTGLGALADSRPALAIVKPPAAASTKATTRDAVQDRHVSEPVLTPIMPPPGPSLPEVHSLEGTPPPVLRRRVSRRALRDWGAAIAAAALVAAVVITATREPSARPRHPYNLLSLSVEPHPGNLRLRWNPDGLADRFGGSGTLSITDGLQDRVIRFNAADLARGYYDYAASSPDVNFRLEVGSGAHAWTESVRAHNTEALAANNPEPAPAPQVPPPSAPPEQTRARRPAPQKQTFQIAARSRQTEHVPRMELPAPPAIEFAQKVGGPSVFDRARHSATTAFVSVEPLRPSALRKAIGWIPGIKHLRKRQEEQDDFVSTRPVRQIHPLAPAGVAPGLNAVAVKVAISNSGEVQDVDLLTKRADPRLAEAAMEAAKNWKFEPARLNGKPVSSGVILHFEFPVRSAGG